MGSWDAENLRLILGIFIRKSIIGLESALRTHGTFKG